MIEREPDLLWRFRNEFQADRVLCEQALTVLGEPVPERDSVLIRTDSQSVDSAIARALALVQDGIPAKVELTDADTND